MLLGKIENVPRGIRGEKSRKDTASSVKLVYNWNISQSPKGGGTEPGVRKGKRSLLASHTHCKCSIETTLNSVKVKPGIKVMKIDGKSDRLGSHCNCSTKDMEVGNGGKIVMLIIQ